jgi:predicted AAA+ superfamily ATPase
LQVIDTLKNEFHAEHNDIIFVDMENLAWDHIKNYTDLYNEVKQYKHIFVDEVQNIQEWEKAILSLQND